MKVYLVWCDNGEAYEEHFEDVEAVFSSMAGAEKYLDEGYDREPYKMYDRNLRSFIDSTRWVAKKDYACCEGYNKCDVNCPRYKAWIDDDEDYDEDYDEETYTCDDYLNMPDPYSNTDWYYIEEREVKE